MASQEQQPTTTEETFAQRMVRQAGERQRQQGSPIAEAPQETFAQRMVREARERRSRGISVAQPTLSPTPLEIYQSQHFT